MHYIIYKTTNLINGKYYIGKHKTKNLEDGYLGSGKLLKRAIIKYGIQSFHKEILLECSNEQQMDLAEKILVVPDSTNYNLCDGGKGGWSYVNKNTTVEQISRRRTGKHHSEKTLLKLRKPKTESWKNKLRGKRPNFKQNGKNNNNAKKIQTPYGKFDSIKDASDILNISYDNLWYKLKANHLGWYRIEE